MSDRTDLFIDHLKEEIEGLKCERDLLRKAGKQFLEQIKELTNEVTNLKCCENCVYEMNKNPTCNACRCYSHWVSWMEGE